MELQVGDVVELKSGGPNMTITAMGERVAVVWFNQSGGEYEIKQATFDKSVLKKINRLS